MKLKDIKKVSMAELSDMAASKDPARHAQLNKMWSYLRRILKSRFKTFGRHDLAGAVPRRFQKGVPTVKQLGSVEEVKKQIGMALGYLEGKTSTAGGYETAEIPRKKRLEELLGFEMSAQEFTRYKSFLDDMAVLQKETWKKVSDEAVEMILQSRRLGLSIDQFRKNFDYWAAHVHKLSKAKPTKSGKNMPSTYIKNLHLPSIKKWTNSNS